MLNIINNYVCSNAFIKMSSIVFSKYCYLKLKGLVVKNFIRYAVIGVMLLMVGCAQQQINSTAESKIEAESYAQGLQDAMTGDVSHNNHCSGEYDKICHDAYMKGVQAGMSDKIKA
jgi:hypothetical protein